MVGQSLVLAAVGALAAIGVLRWSWSLAGRSGPANLAGWGLLSASMGVAGGLAGAWGVAVVSLVAMAGAAGLLGWAAAASPVRSAKAPERRARLTRDAGNRPRLGARLLTFAMVALAGPLAAIALAVALRAAGVAVGWSEADANAAALFALPLAWGILASVLLMLRTRRKQVAVLVITALPLAPALLAGS